MKLAVFGATGPLGTQIIKQALDEGHTVTAFARNPSSLAIQHSQLITVQGDVFDQASVDKAVKGQEAVLCSLGSQPNVKEPVVSEGTKHIIAAMEKYSVKRLICVTAMGTGESYPEASLMSKFGSRTFLKGLYEDKAKQETAVKSSQLDWIIVRPSILTNAPKSDTYRVGEHLKLGFLARSARADVADFILKQLTSTTYVRKGVGIVS